MTGLMLDNPFWKFSLALYSAPGVADECLALQEDHGIDVNVLLFCAWLGWSRGIGLMPKDIEAIEAVVGPWHEGSVKPLRAVRQFTKGMPEDEIGKLRKRVKAIELDAEQVEQAILYAYAEEQLTREGEPPFLSVIAENLEAFLVAHGYRRQGPDDAPLKCLYQTILASNPKP